MARMTGCSRVGTGSMKPTIESEEVVNFGNDGAVGTGTYPFMIISSGRDGRD
jgi:hypothetical protein